MRSKSNNLLGSKSDELIAPELVDPIDKLIAAILANAAQDANRGDIAAIEWLDSEAGQEHCEAVGINWLAVRNTVRAWADSPIRRPVRRKRNGKGGGHGDYELECM